MSYGVRVLGRPEILAGFALAGLPTIAVASGDAAAQIRALARDPQLGILLVEQDAYDRVEPELERLTGHRPLPMVVPVPAPRWKDGERAAKDYIVEMLRRAIGYRVRFR